jgi:RNA polymerase sigma factor (sigma-70 family)
LNQLLRGATDTTFVDVEDQAALVAAGVRYIITLDADTRLPRETVRRLRATVAAALASLPPRERELVALRFHGGLSTAEIARVLGVSERAAAMRVHRAVTRLRELCRVP